LEYFTARLSRWRDFAQDAKTGKSTAFPFAAETSAKENKAEKEKNLFFAYSAPCGEDNYSIQT